MDIIQILDCPEFIAGDNTILREILHPDKRNLDIRYSLAHARVKPGQTSYRHTLRTSEIYYILDGQGEMMINNEKQVVKPGDTIYIPPQAIQCIRNIADKDLVFLCVVDPAWRAEDEIIIDDNHSEKDSLNFSKLPD
jgi:mannose-6-phosphate isomerase-like protein (cupin superfamily)